MLFYSELKFPGGQCLPFVKPTNSNVTVVSEHVYEEESFDDIVLFEIGTQLDITCAEGEQLQGDKLLSCQENGKSNQLHVQLLRFLYLKPITHLKYFF